MLTGLCCALLARLGLMVIGGEGAVVMGGVAAAVVPPLDDGRVPLVVTIAMMLSGMAAGAIWIGAAGALRALRGVNETISSLLLSYIAIALMNHLVEGPLKDPASLNKPSTEHIGDANLLTNIPGLDVHWGLVYGIVACFVCYVLMDVSTFGFGARIVGGNLRAARLSGLGVSKLVIVTCAIGGACSRARRNGRGRGRPRQGQRFPDRGLRLHRDLGGLPRPPQSARGDPRRAAARRHQRQRRPLAAHLLALPDATVNVMQGILFVVLLASETYRGKVKLFSRFVEAS